MHRIHQKRDRRKIDALFDCQTSVLLSSLPYNLLDNPYSQKQLVMVI